MLGADPAACPGLAILRRRGLAAWIGALGPEPRAETQCRTHRSTPATTHDPSPAANDLTRLIAGILVTLVTELAHA
jgi:hypothetical protein